MKTTTTTSARGHHAPQHSSTDLPAPRGRTLFLAAVVFGVSLMLTGWIGGKQEDVLTGRLAASSQMITAANDGRIAEVLVSEGQTVRPREAIIRIENEALKLEIAAAEKAVAFSEDQWRQAVAKADVDLSWRKRHIAGEMLQTRLRMTELLQQQYDQQIQLQAWKDRLERLGSGRTPTAPEDVFRAASFSRKLPGVGDLEAMIQHEATRNAAEVSRVQLKLCEKRLEELKLLQADLPARIHKAFGVDTAASRLEAAKSKLAALQAREAVHDVVCGNYGTLGNYRHRIGDVVKAGDEIVEVRDMSQRYLIVDVPANKLAQVLQSEHVKLRFPGGEKFEGKVGARIDQPSGSTDGDTTAVRIEPAGKLWPDVPLGSAVEVVLEPSE